MKLYQVNDLLLEILVNQILMLIERFMKYIREIKDIREFTQAHLQGFLLLHSRMFNKLIIGVYRHRQPTFSNWCFIPKIHFMSFKKCKFRSEFFKRFFNPFSCHPPLFILTHFFVLRGYEKFLVQLEH